MKRTSTQMFFVFCKFCDSFFYLDLLLIGIHESQNSWGLWRSILTTLSHFHPLHKYLDITQVITAERSLLHIANERPQSKNLWFPSASW